MDSASQLFMYAVALGIAAFIPGPGMTALLFSTLSRGWRQSCLMLLGLITGDLIYLSLALFGLFQSSDFLQGIYFKGLMMLCCLYLFYLSWKYWHFNQNLLPADLPETAQQSKNSYIHGLWLTLCNPKTMSFYLALVPVSFGNQILTELTANIYLITCAVLVLVGGFYIGCSFQFKQYMNNLFIQRLLLKSVALIMSGLALKMMFSEFS